MSDKFDYYDAIAHLVPGTLGLVVLVYFMYLSGLSLPSLPAGNAGALAIGVALAYLLGHILQSLASTLEPLFYFLWGGKPSIKYLMNDAEFINGVQRHELLSQMEDFFGLPRAADTPRSERPRHYDYLFDRCKTLCNKEKLGRVEKFVTVYGFHRVMLTIFFLAFLSFGLVWVLYYTKHLLLTGTKLSELHFILALVGIGLVIEFPRTKKRGMHYSREVFFQSLEHIQAACRLQSSAVSGFSSRKIPVPDAVASED
jgi:hypothetical protein